MINYIIQIVLFQTLFLAVYDLFLQKETFFKWNRIYLLVTPFLSFVIPLLRFESIQKSVPQEYIVQLPTVFLNPQVVIEQTTANSSTLNYLNIAFYIGIVVFTVLFAVRLFKIIKLIISNKIIKNENYNLVLLKKKQSAFSFFNYIFINKHLLENEDLEIIKHELVHCKQKHSIDLLVFELLKIVLWFNPLIYVFQNRITLLHEYISDAEVVKDSCKKTYFNKLLSETFNVENISFINQFYKHSLIKKRIVMIAKEKSQKIMQLKYLLMIPLVGGMLVLSSFENKNESKKNELPVNNEFWDLNEKTENKTTEYLKTEKNNSVFRSKDTIIETLEVETLDVPFAIIENVPVYPGCEGTEEELRRCLQEQITKHVSKNFNSRLADSLGLSPGVKRIFVMFKIDKEGKITDVKARAPHQSLEDEAIRVVNSLPKMEPGKQKGKNMGVKYSLPIAFKIEDKLATKDQLKKSKEDFIKGNENYNEKELKHREKWEYIENESVPFAIIENVPVFPGCEGTEEELRKCLQEKITELVAVNFNSKMANNLGLSPGVKRIFVMFKIDKEGKITDVKARAPHKDLQEEAIRVVQSIPNMIPGKFKGKVVGVKYSLPIAFNVN